MTLSGLDDQLSGMSGAWSLFVRGDRVVLRIDFTRKELTTTTLPALMSSGPVSFIATKAGVIVHPDSVPGYFVPDKTQPRALPDLLGLRGPVVPGPDPSHVWIEATQFNPIKIRLVGADGQPAGPSIPIPANAQDGIRPDGGGYPLLLTSGGVFDARPDGLHRITTGTVEAVGPTGWLAVECDENNQCSRIVIDRGTGDRHTLPGRVTHYSPLEGLIAPDGSVAVLGGLEPNNTRIWLLNLHTGRLHGISVMPLGRTFLSPDTAAWSPDSRWLYLINDNGDLVAIDARTREIRRLDLGPQELPDFDQLSLRSHS